MVYIHGEMAEWSNAVASKAIIPSDGDRGFESPSLLHFSCYYAIEKDYALMGAISFN
jgi:hypothetical protein